MPITPWPKSASFSRWSDDVLVEDVGDRGLEDEVDHLLLAAEQLLDLGPGRRVADPGVAGALAELAADVVEELLVGPVAVDVALREAHRLEVGLGPGVVEPLAEGGAVVERDPEVRVGDEEAQAAPAEVELAITELVEQADDVGAGADDEALVGERPLQRAGAAEPLAALEHEHAAAGPRQVGGRGEAVVAAADDDRVPLAARRARRPAPAARPRRAARRSRSCDHLLAQGLHVAVGDHQVEGVDVDLLGRVAAGRVAARADPLLAQFADVPVLPLTMSQKPTASEGSKSARAIVAGSKNHSQMTSVRPGARGHRVCSIT